MKNTFDVQLLSPITLRESPVCNLAHLLFGKLEHRSEDSVIIMSHIDHELASIHIERLRYITGGLYKKFEQIGLKRKDTVILASLPGNNELYISLLFLALSSYGIRVFLPMYMESDDLKEWVSNSGTCKILMSIDEIRSLKHQRGKKNALNKIIEVSNSIGIDVIDFRKDLELDALLKAETFDHSEFEYHIEKAIDETSLDEEALIITTSGTSGKSKLVVYKQRSFVNSCLSWEAARFYEEDRFGGRGFTPLFTHTMGIRAFFNALWSGQPMCLIITDWFLEKPEIVNYFLRRMKPQHITGGPAIFNLFLELIRNFPELNDVALNSFQCLVGSGAAFDKKFEKRIQNQFGLTPHNAYGTTETQQALNTVLNKDNSKVGLGEPLPGVKIGLKAFDSENNIYQLFVKTPFGCDHIINDTKSFTEDGYFDSGDLVLYDGEHIEYYGRENIDFIKDQFGVKIPLKSVRNYYNSLHEKTHHIEYFSINDTPGLAALLFINQSGDTFEPTGNNLLSKQFKGYISTTNNELHETIEPFEYNHRSIKRARIVFAQVPKTSKGNPSRYLIKEAFEKEIKELTDPMVLASSIINLNDDFEYTDSFTRYSNPYIGQMLHTLGIDISFHRGEINYLYTMVKGQEIRVLDFTGGYGTNLLGHNQPDLKDEITHFLDRNEVAISDQGSIQNYPGELAKKLSIKLGHLTNRNYNVLFGNSGSEVVEMALHHALLAWKKEFEKLRDMQFQIFGGECSDLLTSIWSSNEAIINSTKCGVIAMRSGFHGNSTGARSMLGNDKKRLLFRNLTNVQPLFIDDQAVDWNDSLQKYHAESQIKLERVKYQDGKYVRAEFKFPGIIASIAEPVIGEGGIRKVNEELLKTLAQDSTPLIIDEIQSGLGRCGTFLASQGINADYYLFGKALGGNLTKLSAVCIDQHVYVKKFGEYYVSTFANGGLATKVGSKVLDIIDRDNVPERCHRTGIQLKNALNTVVDEYPDVLTAIKGKGLMLGIYFQNYSESTSLVLRNLYLNDKLGYIFSSYFYHVHRIRIFPTLSAPNVLRLEPSAYLRPNEIIELTIALRKLCEIIRTGNTYDLLLPLMEFDTFDDNTKMADKVYSTAIDEPHQGVKKVAFIAHYTHPIKDMKMTIPELNKASDTGIRILFNKMQVLLEMNPFLLYSKNIFNNKINFNFIVIPLDSAQMERMHKMGKRREIVSHIQKAVDMAHSLGAEVVSLGAYTSILSDNGMSLVEPKGTKIITGNTLTVATGSKHLIDVAEKNQADKNMKIAVIGAAGNIGSAIAETLINSELSVEKLYLIGRNKHKLQKIYQKLENSNEMPETEISTEFEVLKRCDIIVIATNTSDPIVFSHHLSSTKDVLISDVSVPSAVHEKVYAMENVKYIPFSSFIQLPYDADFLMSSVTPKGTTFCCAAESMLCGLEKNDIKLKGDIPRHAVEEISKLAVKHGLFNKVSSIKSFKEQNSV